VRFLNPNSREEKSGALFWDTWVHGHERRRIVIETNRTRMETVPWDQRQRCLSW
jgi:hypothetical protein